MRLFIWLYGFGSGSDQMVQYDFGSHITWMMRVESFTIDLVLSTMLCVSIYHEYLQIWQNHARVDGTRSMRQLNPGWHGNLHLWCHYSLFIVLMLLLWTSSGGSKTSIRIARKMCLALLEECHVLFKPLSSAHAFDIMTSISSVFSLRWFCQFFPTKTMSPWRNDKMCPPTWRCCPKVTHGISPRPSHLCCRHGISESSSHRQTTIHWGELLTDGHIAPCAVNSSADCKNPWWLLQYEPQQMWLLYNCTFITLKESDVFWRKSDDFGCSTTTIETP